MNHKNLLKIKCITKKQFSIKKGSLKKIKEKKDINQNIKKNKKKHIKRSINFFFKKKGQALLGLAS
jgi:hypothetical protein